MTIKPLTTIEKKLSGNTPWSASEALFLLTEADLLAVGKLADGIRRRMHPHGRVTFVVDRNVNYTNVCQSQCKFCAFYRSAEAADAYVLPDETILRKVEELVEHGGTQLLMQGGLHPDLKIEWFEEIFRKIKASFPTVQIHSLSPAEVTHVASLSGLSMPECLRRLQAAGLDSVPGGGAELLVDAVRKEISPNKIGWREWAAVMEEAHAWGCAPRRR
jgi:cyclic dehypoxanthinyl futalosine synthase